MKLFSQEYYYHLWSSDFNQPTICANTCTFKLIFVLQLKLKFVITIGLVYSSNIWFWMQLNQHWCDSVDSVNDLGWIIHAKLLRKWCWKWQEPTGHIFLKKETRRAIGEYFEVFWYCDRKIFYCKMKCLWNSERKFTESQILCRIRTQNREHRTLMTRKLGKEWRQLL